MRTLGGWMFFFGVGSAILSFLGREFIVLAWIDSWGTNIGWVIRIGLIVVGGGMWLAGLKATAQPAKHEGEETEPTET